MEPIKRAYHPAGDKTWIDFNPDGHTYIDNAGAKYLSVTGFVSKFFSKFDAPKMAKRCAGKPGTEYEKMTAEQILQKWEDKRNQAANDGTVLHSYAEWLFTDGQAGEVPDNPNERVAMLIPVVDNAVYRLQKKYHFVAAEMIVFSPGIKLAGTIDLLLYDPQANDMLILDWKQNETITRDSMYRTGLPPVDHLSEDDFNKYSLQLSTYQYLLHCNGYFPEKKYRMGLLHITMTGVNTIKIPYLQKEVQQMIYAINRDFDGRAN